MKNIIINILFLFICRYSIKTYEIVGNPLTKDSQIKEKILLLKSRMNSNSLLNNQSIKNQFLLFKRKIFDSKDNFSRDYRKDIKKRNDFARMRHGKEVIDPFDGTNKTPKNLFSDNVQSFDVLEVPKPKYNAPEAKELDEDEEGEYEDEEGEYEDEKDYEKEKEPQNEKDSNKSEKVSNAELKSDHDFSNGDHYDEYANDEKYSDEYDEGTIEEQYEDILEENKKHEDDHIKNDYYIDFLDRKSNAENERKMNPNKVLSLDEVVDKSLKEDKNVIFDDMVDLFIETEDAGQSCMSNAELEKLLDEYKEKNFDAWGERGNIMVQILLKEIYLNMYEGYSEKEKDQEGSKGNKEDYEEDYEEEEEEKEKKKKLKQTII